MWIKYFIPEDGDDESHPNVFQAPVNSSTSGLSLSEIIENFPVPGRYQFRYLKVLSPNLQVWFDLIDHTDTIPNTDNIILKVTRISNLVQSNNIDNKVNRQNISQVEHVPKPVPKAPPARVPSPASKPEAISKATDAEKLLQFDSTDDDISQSVFVSAQSTSIKSNGNADLLGIDTSDSIPYPQTAKGNSSLDLFGLDTLQPLQATPTSMPTMGNLSGAPMNSQSPYGGLPTRPMSTNIDPFGNLDNSGKSVGGYDRRGSTGSVPGRGAPSYLAQQQQQRKQF